MYVYIKSSPTTWTVGFYTNEGERWNAESDHFSEEAAQSQVAYLNGQKDFTEMSTVKELADERNALRDEVAELKRDISELVVLLIASIENIEATTNAAKNALEAFMIMKLNSPVK